MTARKCFTYIIRVCVYAVGVYSIEVPPVPIPNTVVKLIRAENTWREAAWKDRSVPTQMWPKVPPSVTIELNNALIAQSVEHAAVNRGVTGSSPVWGAITARKF